jgi:4-amino-4-deoxy-L-arabinose transferase-like glycosyltransferase
MPGEAAPVVERAQPRAARPEFAVLHGSAETPREVPGAPVSALPAQIFIEPASEPVRELVCAAEPIVAIAPITAPAVAPVPLATTGHATATPIFSNAATVFEPAAPQAAASAGETPVPAAKLPDAPAVPAPLSSAQPIAWSDLLWLALLAIIGTGLGIRDPWPADEPRFAAVARDMVATGEWLFPRVGGDLYQDKPPVFFWLLAVCYTLTGSLKAAFLIPSFFSAGAVMFLVYDLGRRLVSRTAGVAAAILVVSTLHFVLAMRGAQIDPTLCFLTTFSLYALLRHVFLGSSWRWYFLGGLAAGLGIITKGVGFLPLLALVPYFLMRAFRWQGLAPIDAGRGGWRWWLAPLAMMLGVCLWFVPMLMAVAASGAPEYVAYRDEILFKQTVGRYASAWHHLKGWTYFVVKVIPGLWLPWSFLLLWLVPGFRRAWQERDARVWLPLSWMLLVILFFSASPGKRGIYVLPALPALAIASLPLIREVIAKKSVRVASIAFAALFGIAGIAAMFVTAQKPIPYATTSLLLTYTAIATICIGFVLWRARVAAFPAAVAALTVWFSYWVAPLMNGERSGRDFTQTMLAQVKPGEELGLVAYKEQFLLYLDRPTVNFGHRRWLEGPQEAYDAAAWLAAAPNRVLLVPDDTLEPCFSNLEGIGLSSREHWHLVRAPAAAACVEKGDAARAISYDPTR